MALRDGIVGLADVIVARCVGTRSEPRAVFTLVFAKEMAEEATLADKSGDQARKLWRPLIGRIKVSLDIRRRTLASPLFMQTLALVARKRPHSTPPAQGRIAGLGLIWRVKDDIFTFEPAPPVVFRGDGPQRIIDWSPLLLVAVSRDLASPWATMMSYDHGFYTLPVIKVLRGFSFKQRTDLNLLLVRIHQGK